MASKTRLFEYLETIVLTLLRPVGGVVIKEISLTLDRDRFKVLGIGVAEREMTLMPFFKDLICSFCLTISNSILKKKIYYEHGPPFFCPNPFRLEDSLPASD